MTMPVPMPMPMPMPMHGNPDFAEIKVTRFSVHRTLELELELEPPWHMHEKNGEFGQIQRAGCTLSSLYILYIA